MGQLHTQLRRNKRRAPTSALALILCQMIALPGISLSETGQASSPVDNPADVLRAGQRGNGGEGNGLGCNVPTDGTASPLYGAEPFTQSFMREEGFGTGPLRREDQDPCADATNCPHQFDPPTDESGSAYAYGTQNTEVLDGLISQSLTPYPTRMSNRTASNPWQSAIESTHTGPLLPLSEGALSSYAEGRAPGEPYAHQRWDELFPTQSMTTAVAGARMNTGFRDTMQRHEYGSGEWAPGGLYHNTVHGMKAAACGSLTNQASCEALANHETSDSDRMCEWSGNACSGKFDGTTRGIEPRFHPSMPIQDEQAFWTFDGTFPPKLLITRYGEPLLFRNYNALPIKFEANRGFGNHFITTHEHNGHVGAESDGYAEAFFLPGQFYDYHWPMILAGHDGNPDANDARAALPCKAGESLEISLPSPLVNANGETCDRRNRLSENPSKTGHTQYTDPAACGWRKERATCDATGGNAGRINIAGDWRETMSTHWFHDHMLDYTAQNVYKGSAAMMNYYSALDRGNECRDDGVNLRFPSGCSMGELSWGNRDYDINLMISSKAWGQDSSRYVGTKVDDTQGQLWFNPFNTDGFVGDRILVNLLWMPYLDVRARAYRFRILNADVSRFMTFAFVVERNDEEGEFEGKAPGVSYDRVPIHMIANDGNVMEHSIPFDGSMDLDADGELADHNGILPTQAIAERYDVIIDFDRYTPGTRIYMLNLLEHDDGRGPKKQVDLEDVLDGSYDGCDPAVGELLELRVRQFAGVDGSMDPARYVPGNQNGPDGIPLKMIPLPSMSGEEIANAHHRTFELGRGAASDSEPVTITKVEFSSSSPGAAAVPGSSENAGYLRYGVSVDSKEYVQQPEVPDRPWGIKVDGYGKKRAANFRQVAAAPQIGDLEIWHLINDGNGWSHNMHIHFEEGRILTRDNQAPPEWEKWARKDVYRVGRMDDSGSEVTLAIRFREFGGSYMEHCHNTQHEDHAMLLRWDIENPGQLKPFLLPEPQWNGCTYTESTWLSTASAQNSSSPGNSAAKARFDRSHRTSDILCPAGATQDCAGVPEATNLVETGGPSAPDPATAQPATAPSLAELRATARRLRTEARAARLAIRQADTFDDKRAARAQLRELRVSAKSAKQAAKAAARKEKRERRSARTGRTR